MPQHEHQFSCQKTGNKPFSNTYKWIKHCLNLIACLLPCFQYTLHNCRLAHSLDAHPQVYRHHVNKIKDLILSVLLFCDYFSGSCRSIPSVRRTHQWRIVSMTAATTEAVTGWTASTTMLQTQATGRQRSCRCHRSLPPPPTASALTPTLARARGMKGYKSSEHQ